METEFSKDILIEQIKNGRKIGKELGSIEVKSDMYQISETTLSDEHYIKVLTKYIAETNLSYSKLRNHYKTCLSTFKYTLKFAATEIDFSDEEEEIDFIASMYLIYSKEEFEEINLIRKECRELENVVIETTALAYKVECFNKLYSHLKSKNAEQLKSQSKQINSFKDWFKDPKDYESTFNKLTHIFILEKNNCIRYIGENSEVKAVCYLILILAKKGYLQKTSRVNNTQSKLIQHLRTAFNIEFTKQAFSLHKSLKVEDPCYSDVDKFIPYKV